MNSIRSVKISCYDEFQRLSSRSEIRAGKTAKLRKKSTLPLIGLRCQVDQQQLKGVLDNLGILVEQGVVTDFPEKKILGGVEFRIEILNGNGVHRLRLFNPTVSENPTIQELGAKLVMIDSITFGQAFLSHLGIRVTLERPM